MHENMYFAEAHAMEMLSDRVVQRAEKLLRPRQRRQQQATETVVTTAGGVVARTLRSVASSSKDEPMVAEGADLLHGLSQADVDRLLTTGSSSEPAAPTPPAVETLPPPVQGRALPAPWLPRRRKGAEASHSSKRSRRADVDRSRLSFAEDDEG